LRIFPLYFAFLAATLWILPLVREMEPEFASFREEQVWYWTYLFNWRVAFEGWPEFTPLGHFWSLAVEEQFYLVWPFVVLFFRRATLAWICVGCILGSLALRVWFVAEGHPIAAYVLTPVRLDALAMGGLLAIWVRNPATHAALARYAPKLLLACLVSVAMVFVIHRSFWPWGPVTLTLGLSMAVLASASLMATLLLRPEPAWLPGVFRSRVMRFLGRYSYGI
jgi:peptidoglycan/LPS O-acetylase OafA/YrhL